MTTTNATDPLPAISTLLDSLKSSDKTNKSNLTNTTTLQAPSNEPNIMSKIFYIKFSTVARPFKLPQWAEIAAKGKEHFMDPGMRCLRRKVGAETFYMYQLNKAFPKDGHVLKFTCAGEEHSFTLVTEDPTQSRKYNQTQSARENPKMF